MKKQTGHYLNAVTENKSLLEFVHDESFPVDIKDHKTGQYVANNEAAAIVSGLSTKERLGLDVYDIGKINGLTESAIQNIVQADRCVAPDKPIVSVVHIFVDKTKDTVLVDKVVKKAVVNQSHHMTGILSYAKDIAPYIDRTTLFSYYKTYYPIQKAIYKFLDYLKLANCFLVLPTEKELLVLLTLHPLKESEAISQELAMPKTEVQQCQQKLKNKLTIIEYDEIIARLKVPHMFDGIGDVR